MLRRKASRKINQIKQIIAALELNIINNQDLPQIKSKCS